ncbi:MAG: porin family protein [Bacteroidota bacterium]
MRVLLCSATCLLLTLCLNAQGFSGGFKAGLNFNQFSGPQEGNEDMSFEDFRTSTGFHVGATFAYGFTDLVGLKGELIYSQKGGEIRYEGPGYFFLYPVGSDPVALSNGTTVVQELSVINSYIDIPITAYYRIGPIEVEGGFNVGLQISSRGSGSVRYNTNSNLPALAEIALNYDANFNSDGPGAESVVSRNPMPLPDGSLLPSVIGGNYNSDRDDNRYERLDFGLVFGVAVFVNSGLYIGARYNHGLTDVTKPENDLRISELGNNGQRLFNEDDEDFNRSIQASVGFRF